MRKAVLITAAAGVMAALVLWWKASVQEDAGGVPDAPVPAMEPVDVPQTTVRPQPAFEPDEAPGATLFGHSPGLTLAEQDERREPERIENVPAEVIEHARTEGFPFEGVVVRVVEEHGFWLVAHDAVDAYMWAAERRPIHPEDPARLGEHGPGDILRGRVFHGEDRYILRLP